MSFNPSIFKQFSKYAQSQNDKQNQIIDKINNTAEPSTLIQDFQQQAQSLNFNDPNLTITFDIWEQLPFYRQTQFSECQDCQKYKLKQNMFSADYCKSCISDNSSTYPNCVAKQSIHSIKQPTKRFPKGSCPDCNISCEYCDTEISPEESYFVESEEKTLCESCYQEAFASCSYCEKQDFPKDELIYVESEGNDYCKDCFNNNFYSCAVCNEPVLHSEAIEIQEENLHEDCAKTFTKSIHNVQDFSISYNKKDRYLDLLNKIVPISIKDLKSKFPQAAQNLSDLISFSKGQMLTQDILFAYKATLNNEKFPIEYSIWEGPQRSIKTVSDTNKPQLVLNIEASEAMLSKIKQLDAYDLFKRIEEINKGDHPSIPNQLGWVRVELNPKESFILVDEIQSEQTSIAYKAQKNHDYKTIIERFKASNDLDDNELATILIEYDKITKDFPNIASQIVSEFARKHGYKKIYWHTFESGKKLKNNAPPKSLYDATPKENLYKISPDKPFGLNGDFFEKDAKIKNLINKYS